MSIHYHTSPSLENLAYLLGTELQRERRGATLFDQPWVISPNAHLQRWLQFRIADATGIEIGLRFEHPENGAWALLEALRPDPDAKRIKRETVQWMTLALLRSDNLGEAAAPAVAYLGDDTPHAPGGLRKLWQLADRISRYFRTYEYLDPGRCAGWLRQVHEADPWGNLQAALYRAIYSPGGLRDQIAPNQYSIPAFADRCGAIRRAPNGVASLHLFAVRNWNDWLTRFYQSWGEVLDVHLYHVEAGEAAHREAFWSDLLKGWRTVAADARRFWNIPFTPPAEARASVSQLRGMQALLLGQESAAPADNDDSLAFFNAPSVRREIEAVYDDILERMQSEPDLRLTDIGILIAGMAEYQQAILSVFGRVDPGLDPYRPVIPFNLVDTQAGDESLYADAVRELLRMIEEDASQASLLAWVRNPAVREARNLNEATLADWHCWAQGLPVQYGLAPDAPSGWWRGLRRLTWGRVMTMDPDETTARVYDGITPYRDSLVEDGASIGALSNLLEILTRLRQTLRNPELPWGERLRLFRQTLPRLVAPPAEIPGEATVANALHEALEDAARRPPIPDMPTAPQALLRLLIEASLAPVPLRRGKRFCGGVTIAALKPESAIPYKQLYVLGLGAGRYPGEAGESPLDLLTPAPGNRDHPTHARQAFLDALLSCRGRLRLSWVGRDLQADKVFAPCGLLVTLREALREAGHPVPPIYEVPLHAGSLRYLEEDAQPPSTRRFDVLQRAAALEEALPPVIAQALEDARRDAAFALPADTVPEETHERIDTQLLRRFLELPAQATLARRLHLGREEEAEELIEEEPLTLASFTQGRILQHCFESLLLAHCQEPLMSAEAIAERVQAIRDAAAHSLRGGGLLPGGAFGERALSAVLERFEALALGSLSDFLLARLGQRPHVGIALGESIPQPRITEQHPPLHLPDGTALEGGLSWIWEGEAGLDMLVLTLFSSSANKRPTKHLLAPFLSLCAYAAERDDMPPAKIHQLFGDGRLLVYPFPEDLNPQAYLQALSTAWKEDPRLLGLPYKYTADPNSSFYKELPAPLLREWLADRIDDTYARLRWPDGLRLADWEIPPEYAEILATRLAPILAMEAE